MSASRAEPFVPGPRVLLRGCAQGPLSERSVAVKDLFHLAGFRTGAGNPDWLKDHPPATETAPAVQKLLVAGAYVVGKALTDELAYSLGGENFHYGTPLNPAAPECTPGGSSSGSASAVARGLADIGLGTDTGGSIRVPAAYCGLFGLRPSWGAVPVQGVVPLAPRFDTVGWLTRDAATLRAVGEVLLPFAQTPAPTRLVLASPLFSLLSEAGRAALAEPLACLRRHFAEVVELDFDPTLAAAGADAFRVLQGRDIWRSHGAWVTARRPAFGPGIAERFAMCATLSSADEAAAEGTAARIRALAPPPDTVLCLPTVPAAAPRVGAAAEDLAAMRVRLMQLTCLAGLAGTPQAHLPVAQLNGAPFGLSLLAPRGHDRALLALVESLSSHLPCPISLPRS